MDYSPRELIYLALLVGTLLLFQRLKRLFLLFALAVLPGTFCHELCHLCVGWLLGGKPANFTLLPKREGHAYVLGSVAFAQIRWYNAFFLGMAPLLMLPLAYALLTWRLKNHPVLNWGEGFAFYLIANLIYASLPSWQDFRIAARSPVGWLLLVAAVVFAWYHFQSPRQLGQFEVPGLSRLHAALGDPGADIRLGQAHEIG